MKVPVFELLALMWRRRATQWWRLWFSQGGTAASLRGMQPCRLAQAAREAAGECSRVADVFQALADAYPLGLMWQREGAGREAAAGL